MIIYNFRFPFFTAAALIAATGGLTSGVSLSGVIFPGTNKSFLLLEIDAEGGGNASANGEFSVFRTITTAAAGALTTVVTGQPIDQVATNPAFTGSAGQGSFATTQPILAGAPLMSFGLNANGQRYFWRANPNLNNAIVVPGTPTALLGGLVFCQTGGSAVMSAMMRVQIAEL